MVVDRSFITLYTEPTDGTVEFTGVAAGYIDTDNNIKLPDDSWSIEMWYQRSQAVSRGGALMSVSKAAASDRIVSDPTSSDFNTPFVLFDSGSSGYGFRMLYGGKKQVVETYRTSGGVWTHIVAGVKRTGGKCEPYLYHNGVQTALRTNVPSAGLPSIACSRGAPDEFGDGAGKGYTLRIGHRLEGSINDVIIHKTLLSEAQIQTTMHMMKPWSGTPSSSWLLAWSFNEPSATEFKDHVPGNNSKGTVKAGVFRGLIYGITHKWKNCPGTNLRNPERVCNNDVHAERGVCFLNDDNDLSLECNCNEGFAVRKFLLKH